MAILNAGSMTALGGARIDYRLRQSSFSFEPAMGEAGDLGGRPRGAARFLHLRERILMTDV
jgi:hypothetical protein